MTQSDSIEMAFPDDESRSMLPGPLEPLRTRVLSVRKEALAKSLSEMVANMNDVLRDVQKETATALLTEVSVAIQFNTEGGISWIGSAKAGSSSAMTLTFQVK